MKLIILKQASLYLIGDVFSKIVPFLIIPYLTNKLSVNSFGQLSFYLAIMYMLSTILNFGQDVVYTKSKFKHDINRSKAMFIIGLLLSTGIALLIQLLSSFINSDLPLTLLIAVSYFSFLSNKIFSYLQTNVKVSTYLGCQIFNGIFSSILTVVVFEVGAVSPESRIWAILISYVMMVAYFFYKFFGDIFISKFEAKRDLLYFFSNALPILLHGVALVSRSSLDKIIIKQQFSLFDLSIYSLGFQLASVFNLILVSLNKGVMPHYFNVLSNSKIDKNKILKLGMITLIASPLSYGLMVLIPDDLYFLVFGEGYKGVGTIVAILVASFFIQIPYFIFGNYLIFNDKNKILATTTILSTIFYLITLRFFASSIIDVAFSYMVSMLLQVFILSFALVRSK